MSNKIFLHLTLTTGDRTKIRLGVQKWGTKRGRQNERKERRTYSGDTTVSSLVKGTLETEGDVGRVILIKSVIFKKIWSVGFGARKDKKSESKAILLKIFF